MRVWWMRRSKRNSREENTQIKDGETPKRFKDNPHVARQKENDARRVKKNNESHYGYKNHVSVDVKHNLIRETVKSMRRALGITL